MLLVDAYKVNHQRMYPENMTKLYSNLTPRKSRINGIDKVVVFGIQHFILTYLIKAFNEDFFLSRFRKDGVYEGNITEEELLQRKEQIISEYKSHCNVDTTHIEKLWDLGYLPLEIKALEEGTECPIGVPLLTITNTHPDFGWLVNYLETLLSCMLWQSITSATIAHEYKKILDKYAKETTGSTEGVQWQGHDFSMRGMSSPESAILSGMGHLLSFTGTDTIPAIYQLERSYNGDGLIGASVPATEHSVMCMGTKEDEIKTFERLLNLYPEGILSVVSDTWDLWKVCTEYLPILKDKILARNGKLVIRPDSGDPVDIICGAGTGKIPMEQVSGNYTEYRKFNNHVSEAEWKGVIELLWDIFGGTIVKGADGKDYKVLDSHIGAIYGDSITTERATAICERLKAKGFASTNIVFGIGSYTYQYNTRDTFGFAMKATYGEITHQDCDCTMPAYGWTDNPRCKCINVESREIFKDPITDDGTKKSAKGLLSVRQNSAEHKTEPNKIWLAHQQTWAEEKTGLLKTVFLDGKLTKTVTLTEIRERLNK